MVKAIFYARFHPERGPSVIHQYPFNTVVSSDPSNHQTLINFSELSSYIIPPYEVCNQAFSITTNGYRVLGFPVSLEDAKYARNRFTFSVCFVLSEDEDAKPWQQIVRKAASFFKTIEEEDGMLQSEELLDGLKWAGEAKYPAKAVGVVLELLTSIFEQLHTYGEACVRLSDLHVLSLRIVPHRASPPKVRAWDVPLLIRPMPSSKVWTWDLTLQRIHEHIDGLNHVQRISEVADVELRLVKDAIEELVRYGNVMVLGIFHFQGIYALTNDFAWFVTSTNLQQECCNYIATSTSKPTTKPSAVSTELTASNVLTLYRTLSPGVNLQDFCVTNQSHLIKIDTRRFITFGVIKGFVRRAHKYALVFESQPGTPQARISAGSLPTTVRSNDAAALKLDEAWKKAALSSGWPTPPHNPATLLQAKDVAAEQDVSQEDETLRGFLDGKHCMDEICVTMHMSERQVQARLKSGKFGEVAIFCS